MAEMHSASRRQFTAGLVVAAVSDTRAQTNLANDRRLLDLLIRRVESDYPPQGKTAPPKLTIEFVRNNQGGASPFSVTSSLDIRAEGNSSSNILLLNLRSVDAFLNGRGIAGLQSFHYLSNVVLPDELYNDIVQPLLITRCQSLQLALLGMLRLVPLNSSLIQFLMQIASNVSAPASTASLLALTQSGARNRTFGWRNSDMQLVEEAASKLARAKRVELANGLILIVALSDLPFLLRNESKIPVQALVRRLLKEHPRHPVLQFYSR